MSRASSPEEGRAVLAMMHEALVEAKVGVSQMRAALEATRGQLARQRTELETVQRRGRLAAQINDTETVRLAAQFERRHGERVAVLERKLAAQEAELALAEREVEEMTAQLKASTVAGGLRSAQPVAAAADPADDGGEALRREVERASREADAERRLAELKRRMGQ